MNLWAFTIAELRRRPFNAFLTLAGIVISVAALTATSAAATAVKAAYRDLFTGLNGPSMVEATAPGRAGFDPGSGAGLDTVTGVRKVVPCIQASAALMGHAGAVPTMFIGSDDFTQSVILRSGRLPEGNDEVLLPTGFAETQGLTTGEKVRLWTPTGPAELHIVGLLKPQGQATANGGAMAVVSLATARHLFGYSGQVNSLHILLDDVADPKRVAAALVDRLPPGITIDPDRRGDLAGTTLRSVELGMTGLGAVALVAAAFVLLNTFLLDYDQRRRQFATLRAVGATRAQVRGLLIREALLLSSAGTLLGIGCGYGLALVLTKVLGKFMGVAVPVPGLPLTVVLCAAVVGPGMALAAAWFPARQAARSNPLHEGVNHSSRTEQALPGRATFLGILSLVLAGILSLALLEGWLPHRQGLTILAPVVGMLAAGGVLVLPPVARLFLGLCGRLPRRCLGAEGNLALGQLQRHPTRTGLTAGVLFVTVVMAVAFGQVLRNTLEDLRGWYRRAIPADFLVRGAMPDTALLMAPALPETLANDLTALDGVERVDKIAFVPARLNGTQILLLARTFAADGPTPMDVRGDDPKAVLARVRSGGAVLDVGLARKLRVGVGDTVTLETPTGPRELKVAGTVTEYAAGGNALYLHWDTARQLLPLPGVHVFLVTARPGDTAMAGAALRRQCEQQGLMLQANDDLRGWIDQLLSQVAAALWALTALAFLVASLGVANTLLMNVRQQQREFGMLRAVGLTRGQLRRVVLWQALLTALAGVVPGAVAGVGVAWLLTRLNNVLLGRDVALRVDPGLVAGACVLALLAALIAALVPAIRASRVEVMAAVRA